MMSACASIAADNACASVKELHAALVPVAADAPASLVQQQADVGRNARDADAVVGNCRNDTGDGGPVGILLKCIGVVVDEIPRDDVPRQVGMAHIGARIDDRNPHARAAA